VDDEGNSGRGKLFIEGYPPLGYWLELPCIEPASTATQTAATAATGRWRRPLTAVQQMMESLAVSLPSLSTSASLAQQQVLRISNFPPHRVERLSEWEWMIANENVTFISSFLQCDAEGAWGDVKDHPVLSKLSF